MLQRFPILVIPTVFTTVLVTTLHHSGLLYCGNPNITQLFTYSDAIKSGLLAPLGPLSSSHAGIYSAPLWFIEVIFYANLGSVAIAIIFRMIFREKLIIFTLSTLAVFFFLHIQLSHFQWAKDYLFPIAFSIFTGVILAWWHVRYDPKIKNVIFASILLSVSLLILLHVFLTHAFGILTGRTFQLQFHKMAFINTVGAIGILHASLSNPEMCSACQNNLPPTLLSLAYPLYFFHDIILRFFTCWFMRQASFISEPSYWMVLIMFYFTSVFLICICYFVCKVGVVATFLAKKLFDKKKQ